ncbi:MAG: hypothetical protein RLZZ50_219 [Verrucomicrobiota bacterium]
MKSSGWLWGGVALLFALMGCAWTAMFFFARSARVESVPLAAPAATGSEQAGPGAR